MKNVLFFIFLICLCSCSGTKDLNAPINNYLSNLDLKESDSIIIIEEKINNNVTLDIFKGKTFYYTGINKSVRVEGVKEELFNTEDWLIMQSKYQDKSNNEKLSKENLWLLKDFSHKKTSLIKYQTFIDSIKNENSDLKQDYRVFAFSSPIYYKKNKYACIALKSSTTSGRNIDETFVLVMVKVKNKWVVVEKVEDGIYR